MKKKSIIVLLSVTLVLVLASAGVSFATSLPVTFDNLYSSAPFGGTFSNGVFTSSGPNSQVYFDVSFLESGVTYYVVGDYVVSGFSGAESSLYLQKSKYNNNTSSLGGYVTGSGAVYNGDGTYSISGSFTYESAYPYLTMPLPKSGCSVDFRGLYLSDSSSIATVDRYTLSLPYGNALLISSDSGFTINRRVYSIYNTTYNYQKYVRASDNFSYRVNGSYQGVVDNSNLVGSFGVGVYGSNDVMSLLIPWQPVNQNVLGRATQYNYYNASPDPTAEVVVSSGQSFLIWYPYYANNQDTSKINETNMEIVIDISHSSSISFTTLPITGSTATGGEDSYIQNTASVTDSGSSSQSNGGDGSITVTFDNAPTAGGNHGQAPINDNNSILGVLSNLQNTLLGLFNKAIDGIHNLITLGSGFLQSVQIMFSWLPAELLVIITSGFVILLTIGVLKTLWR